MTEKYLIEASSLWNYMNGRYGPNEMVAKHDSNEMNCAAEKRRHTHIPKPKEMHFDITRISTSTFLICLNYKICSHCDFFSYSRL